MCIVGQIMEIISNLWFIHLLCSLHIFFFPEKYTKDIPQSTLLKSVLNVRLGLGFNRPWDFYWYKSKSTYQ